MKRKIIMGADRLAIPLKDELKSYLESRYGLEVTDVGMQAEGDFVSYIDTACRAAKEIQKGNYERGILLCGTGAGMTLVANKFRGIRAVLCSSPYEAKMCRTINDANVMCLGGSIVTPVIGKLLVDEFMNTPFKEAFPADRHEFLESAKGEIARIEAENFKECGR